MVDFQTQIVPQLRDHHHDGGLCSTTAISENDCGSITNGLWKPTMISVIGGSCHWY